MSTHPSIHPEREVTPARKSMEKTRADIGATLNFGTFPDLKLRNLLASVNKLPEQIIHSEYRLQCKYLFNQMDEYVQTGFLVKKGRHYEPVPGKEEDGQKIIAAFNEVMKVLRKKDTEEPFILESKAA